MSRWFYQYAINYRTYNIFETSEYGDDQGYATKAEAVDAAINHANSEILMLCQRMEYDAVKMKDITKERTKLMGMLP
jgi:hypothetical protein